jgi:uncharacterized protein (TIGR02117 family)
MNLIRKGNLLCILVILALSGLGCVGPANGLSTASSQSGQTPKTVYVLHRGLHTGVIIRTADIPPGLWPEHKEFPQAKFIEVGWGDSEGYRYPLTMRVMLRAMFNSKGSVLLIHAFSGPIIEEYTDAGKEIVAVPVSQSGLAHLCAYIQDYYALNVQGRPIPLPTVYRGENFFLATGHYSMLDNCNNWTARALVAAGCPMAPRRCVLPGIVMSQARRSGSVIWRRGQAERMDRNNVTNASSEKSFAKMHGPNRIAVRKCSLQRRISGIAIQEAAGWH